MKSFDQIKFTCSDLPWIFKKVIIFFLNGGAMRPRHAGRGSRVQRVGAVAQRSGACVRWKWKLHFRPRELKWEETNFSGGWIWLNPSKSNNFEFILFFQPNISTLSTGVLKGDCFEEEVSVILLAPMCIPLLNSNNLNFYGGGGKKDTAERKFVALI